MAGTLSAGSVAATGGGANAQGPPPAYNLNQPTTSAGTSAVAAQPLSSFYPTTPTASTFGSSTAGVSTTGTAPTAAASTLGTMASINNGNINPNDATNAASQLNAITSSNSPYIQLAQQQGMLSAAQRGLQNSSLASGASEAAAVQAAAPLAEQNAQSATAGELQNSQLQTQASEFNAGQQNANQQLNAQLATQTNQFNASQAQTAAATNAAAVNAINQQITGIIGSINQQGLSGNQAQILAGIQGQYSELISQNQTAGAMVQSYMSALSAMMANPQIDQGRINTESTVLLNNLNSQLGMLNTINGGTNKASAISAGGAPTTTVNPTAKAPAANFAASIGATTAAPAAPAAKQTQPVTVNPYGAMIGATGTPA